jgi:hypothetical protein
VHQEICVYLGDFSIVRGLVGAVLTGGLVYVSTGPEDSRWWWLAAPLVGIVSAFIGGEDGYGPDGGGDDG